MSTILKALKKLEEEQRAAAPVSLAEKVLTIPGQERRSAYKRPWVAAGVVGGLLVAALAVSVIYWLSGAPQLQTVPVAQQAPLPAEPAPVTAGLPQTVAAARPAAQVSAPAPPAADKTQPVAAVKAPPPSPPRSANGREKPAAAPAQPARVAAPAAVNPLRPAVVPPQPAAAGKAAAQLPVPAAPVITTNPSPRLESAAATPDRVEPVVVAPGQIPPAGRQWTAPHLEVSDILGVAGSGGRMAVVNGLPVMEGTRVENTLVKEIRDSQVIFEIDGRNIVVPKRAAR